jgi:hypothetical protein
MAKQQVIRVGVTKDKAIQSKAQKEFNRLTKKIETAEKEIKELRAAGTTFSQRAQQEMTPLLDQMAELQAQLVRIYDRAYDQKDFKKTEKKKLAHLIETLALEVIERNGNEEIKAIYDKYSEMGVDVDIDVNNPEKTMASVQEKLAELQEAEEQRAREAAERRAKKPKTEKQQAREAKKEEEARNVTKSVRTLYMDLVKAFHPDRETDETEKARKTEIMQRVTQAYEASDLLALLRLQLEFNRIDQDHLETLADEQLKYYNKILKEQAQELDQELYDIQMQLGQMAGVMFGMVHSATQLEYKFKTDLNNLKKQIKQTKSDVEVLSDLFVLKQWLKSYKIPKQDEFAFFELFR